MPVKKATAARPAAVKKAPAAVKKPAKGAQYACAVCGLVISVDETCGCVETCDIICCGEPMKEHKKKSTAAKK